MALQETGGPLSVLVIGAGMYVCGRGTAGHGTVLPALVQAQRDGLVGEITVAATSESSIAFLKGKLKELESLLGYHAKVAGFPANGHDAEAYKLALAQIPERACVVVAVPDHLHTEITSEVLRAKKHVLVVKPLAPTVAEVGQLIELARENHLYGAVEFHKRWDWANLKLRQTMRDGTLGDPLYAIVEFSQRKIIPSSIFKGWAAKTNVFQYLGVHYVDLISFALGAVPSRVMAVGQKAWLASQGIDTFDAVEAVIEWHIPNSSAAFTSTILSNWIDPNTTSAMTYQSIKVVGTKGRFESDQKNRGLQLVTDDGGVEDSNPYFTQRYPRADGRSSEYRGYGIDSIRQFLEDAQALFDKQASPRDFEGIRPTFSEALVSTAVIEAANKSLALDGAWINIKLSAQGAIITE